MNHEQTRLAVLDIIQTIVPDEDLAALNDADPLREQIDLDSMDFLDIVMELRKLYGVQVPEDDYPNLATLAGCVTYLQPLLADKEPHCATA
jgi:acyl carrier protein